MATYRDKLIRANFEAYRDLTWVETSEPRLREHGQDKASIEKHRQEWNEHTEREDWPWCRRNRSAFPTPFWNTSEWSASTGWIRLACCGGCRTRPPASGRHSGRFL